MDRLELQLIPGHDEYGGRWVGVHLVVNGENLQDLVTKFEEARGYEPAGGYDAIALRGLAPAISRLTGAPNTWPGDGRTLLLICEGCREEGCWPMYARITIGEDVVEWRDFQQPHRPDRDYSAVRFTFPRSEYDAELSRAFDGPVAKGE